MCVVRDSVRLQTSKARNQIIRLYLPQIPYLNAYFKLHSTNNIKQCHLQLHVPLFYIVSWRQSYKLQPKIVLHKQCGN
jgi:hypothetical protein